MKSGTIRLPMCGLLLAALAGGASAQTRAPAPADEQVERLSQAGVTGLRQPRPGLLTAGQPGPQAWDALAGHGVTTVINLRPDRELAGRDEAAEVAAAGLDYRQVPVADASDLTTTNARTLWRQIERAPDTVLVHCASGNRVGALLAIGAARHGGMDTAQALEFGRSAGLGSLEPRVREVLDDERVP